MLSIITINSLFYYATLRFPPMRGFRDSTFNKMNIEKKQTNKIQPTHPKKHPFPKIKSGTAHNTPRVDRQG